MFILDYRLTSIFTLYTGFVKHLLCTILCTYCVQKHHALTNPVIRVLENQRCESVESVRLEVYWLDAFGTTIAHWALSELLHLFMLLEYMPLRCKSSLSTQWAVVILNASIDCLNHVSTISFFPYDSQSDHTL